ncbi:hypothetical protein [Engelhardtia mirabilis]|uniref:Uncharacterized protein n=1 Tax=Engelhardtia mirabilis TaxID=2528011 RepID=A0A518BFV0_9BACT|nr:hypothetical protein Pla133_09170 [Planctomycetes bacterium Pla133]QDV00177.1 hypothetical protein Pla86_09160 [Planctomycetes bacterium Pla86]
MSEPATTLRLELAHGLPRTPRGAVDDSARMPEAFAHARVIQEGGADGLRALRRWPGVTRLGDAADTWRWEPLPDLVEGLLASLESAGAAQLEVHAPAEVQEALRQRAPRTWQLLLQRTRLVQRGEAWSLERRGSDLRVTYLPEHASGPIEVDCPLLSLAARLRGGGELGPESGGEMWERAGRDEVRKLLRELLRARWLHRRLPPGVRWNAADGTFDLRHSETRPRVREDLGEGAGDVPRRLFVQCEALSTQLEFACAPGSELPLAVVRAGLTWLLDRARDEPSVVLTRDGQFPREG